MDAAPLAKAQATNKKEEAASARESATATAGAENQGDKPHMHVQPLASDAFPSVQASPPVEPSPAPEPPASETSETESASEEPTSATQTPVPPATATASASAGVAPFNNVASSAPPVASEGPLGASKWPTDIGTNSVTFPCKLTVYNRSVGQPPEVCTKLFDELGNCAFDNHRKEFKANPLARVSLPKTLWDQYGAGLPNKFDNPLCGSEFSA